MAYQGPVIRSFESRYGHAVPSEFELLEALEAQQKGEELTGWNTVRMAPNQGFSSGSTTRSTFHGDASRPVTENQLLDKNYQHKPNLGQETLVKGEPQFSTANYGIPTASPYGRTERENKLLEDWKEGRMGIDRYSGVRKNKINQETNVNNSSSSIDVDSLKRMTPRDRIERLATEALTESVKRKTLVPGKDYYQVDPRSPNPRQDTLNRELKIIEQKYGKANAERIVKEMERKGLGEVFNREVPDTSAVDKEGNPIVGKMKSISYSEAMKAKDMNPYEVELAKLPKERARLMKNLSPEWVKSVSSESGLKEIGGVFEPIFRHIIRVETGIDPNEYEIQKYMKENSDLIPAIKAKAQLIDSVDKRMKAYGKPNLPVRGEEEDRWAGVTKQPEPVQTTPPDSTPEKPMSISERMAMIRQSSSPEMRSYVDMMEKLAIAQERSGNREQAQETLNELQGKVLDLQARWNTEDRWSQFQKDAKSEINRQAYESDDKNINPQTRTILDHDTRQNTEEMNPWGNLKFDDYAKKERIMQDVQERLDQGRAMIKQDISSNNIKSAMDKLNGFASNLLKVAGDKGPLRENMRQQIEYAKNLLDTNPVQAGKVIDEIFTEYGQLAGR